ncbi:MAG TPA: OmpA family protein [Gemmatimonadaceae bacterium]|nr:OmpA family protein [Gemmatimonadaceae bacterium]
MYVRSVLVAAVAIASSFGVGGCQSLGNKERGAIIGAAGGAAVGGVIGRNNGSTARGAIIGAVVGGAAGAIIGHQMDQQAKEIEQNVAGARVERVGEGIQVTFASGLLFDFDSSVLRSEARTNLAELARSFDKYPDTELVIVGHTDADGDDAYNQRLSERRAAAARDFLVSRGVAAARVSPAGRGETEPVSANDSVDGRQANRRVEVAIYASEALRERARRDASR